VDSFLGKGNKGRWRVGSKKRDKQREGGSCPWGVRGGRRARRAGGGGGVVTRAYELLVSRGKRARAAGRK